MTLLHRLCAVSSRRCHGAWAVDYLLGGAGGSLHEVPLDHEVSGVLLGGDVGARETDRPAHRHVHEPLGRGDGDQLGTA